LNGFSPSLEFSPSPSQRYLLTYKLDHSSFASGSSWQHSSQKSILVCLGDLLTFSTDPDTTRGTLSALKVTMAHCWARYPIWYHESIAALTFAYRIPPHRGLILASLASSWTLHSRSDSSDQALLVQKDLQDAFHQLKRICQEGDKESWEKDARLLLSTNPLLFGPLVSPVHVSTVS
jgi:hypothetical protein